MTPKTFISQSEAQECCAYWQRQLRLSDWLVKVNIVRRFDLPEGRVADCTYHLDSKSATVRLLYPNDFHPACEFYDRDHEVALVHELEHLLHAGLEPKPDTYEMKIFEFTVESTAQALVLLNRGIRL